jgi:high-affinity Fe2+/Pb2+ permease
MNSIFALLTIGFVLPTKDIVIAGIALAVIILVAALLLFRSTGKGKAGKKAR